jgi:hypothetical protein
VGRRRLLGIALVGMGMLVFETVLTRIFAVTLWYYFGFLAVSIAMLGISAGAMVVHVLPRFGRDRLDETLAACAALFGVTAVLALLFHLNVTFIGTEIGEAGFYLRMLVHVLALMLPFLSGGLVLALVFSRFHAEMPRLYFFDLAGSGVGCVLVIVALTTYSGPAIVLLVAALSMIAALAFAPGRRHWMYLIGLVAFGAAFALNDPVGLIRIRASKSYVAAELQRGEQTGLLAEEWSPLSRTTLGGAYHNRARRFDYLQVENDAGAPTWIHRWRGSVDAMRYTAMDPPKIGLHLVGGHVLIIGAGGGQEIWGALATGHTVVAVEINPITVGWVRGPYAEFSGNPYDHEGVTAVVSEGRSYVAHTDEKFDLVVLTMVDSWVGNAAGAFMFVENNLYTVEAVRAYRRRLRDGGALAITRYYPYGEGLRLTSVVSQGLIEDGIDHPGDHMIVVRDAQPIQTTVLAFQRPVTPELAARAADVVEELGGSVLWAPHLPPGRLATGQADDAYYGRLLDPRLADRREAFIAGFHRNIEPTTDDHPFFFYMHRGSPFEPEVGHPARALALPIVYGLFVSLLGLSLAFLVVPMWWARRGGMTGADGAPLRLPSPVLLLYFACLGVAFMLVEIPLTQQFVLFLGHPTYAFTAILSSMLVFSGVGSLLSSRLRVQDHPRRLAACLGVLVAVLVATLLSVAPLMHGLLGLPLAARILVTVVFLAPVALLMGVPFPGGIRILGQREPGAVAWAWAINGAFSVLASVLALVVAINFGLRASLLVGTAAYVVAVGLLLAALPAASRPARPS